MLGDVYVINLDRAHDRLRSVRTNLHEYGVKFERISAIDGSKLGAKDMTRYTTWLCRTLMCSKSTIGCALSHFVTWNRILKKYPNRSENRWHLILEDDVVFRSNTVSALLHMQSQILGETPYDKRIVHLAPKYPFVDPPCVDVDIETIKLQRPIVLFSTCAYLISTDMVRMITRELRTVYYHIDVVLFNKYKGHTWSTNVDIVSNSGLRPETSFNVSRSTPLPLLERSFVDVPAARFVMRTTVACIGTRVDISVARLIWFLMLVIAVSTKRLRLGMSAYLISETCVSTMLDRSRKRIS